LIRARAPVRQGDGHYSKKEFRQACLALGVESSKADVDALFDVLIDPNATGFGLVAALPTLLRAGKGGGKRARALAKLSASYTGSPTGGSRLQTEPGSPPRPITHPAAPPPRDPPRAPLWPPDPPVHQRRVLQQYAGAAPHHASHLASQQPRSSSSTSDSGLRTRRAGFPSKHAPKPPPPKPRAATEGADGTFSLTAVAEPDKPPKQQPKTARAQPATFGSRFPPIKQASGPGPAAYDADSPRASNKKRVTGAHSFGSPASGGRGDVGEIFSLVKKQDAKAACATRTRALHVAARRDSLLIPAPGRGRSTRLCSASRTSRRSLQRWRRAGSSEA